MIKKRILGFFSLENPRGWWLLGALWLSLSLLAAEAVRSASDAETAWLAVCALAGAGTAWALAHGQLSAAKAGGLYASAGVGALFVLTARIPGTLWGLFNETYSILLTRLYEEQIDLGGLGGYFLEIQSRMGGLLARTSQWLIAYSQGRSLEDPVVAGMLWQILFWLLAGWAGWLLARHASVLGAFLPLLAAQAIIMKSHSQAETSLLWANLFIFVSLLGLLLYAARLREWLRAGLDYAENVTINSVVSALSLAALLVGLAGATPSISIEEIQRAIEERRAAQANANGTSGTPVAGAGRPSGTSGERIVAGLPRDHLLGGDVTLTETLVMQVRTYDFPAMPRAEVQLNAPRYYWRAETYDIYSGQGWVSSPVEKADYPAGEIFVAEKPEFYRRLQHDFEIYNQETPPVFRAGILESADVPLDIEWRNVLARLTLPGAPNGSADLFRATSPFNAYRATSLVATVDVETLRGIWPDYPEWVRTRYLALPPLPERVSALARDITATAPSLYDRAEAIERYLRDNYDYTLDVPAPPPGRDPVDYFLFDLGQGYCDYYASAMVVLARASGIPARLVVGYVGGTYDPVDAVYTVREANAHSWVEVYFPQVGWVEFEPTASQPGFQRVSTGAAPLPYVPPDRTRNPWAGLAAWLAGLPVFLPWAGLALLLAGLTFGVYRFAREWRDPRPRSIRQIGRVYSAMQERGLKTLRSKLYESQTPQEFAEALKQHLSANISQGKAQNTLESIDDVETIAGLYQLSVFSERVPGAAEARQADKAWRRLRWRL